MLGLVVLWISVFDEEVNFRRCELLLLGGRDGLDDQLASGEPDFRGELLTPQSFHKVPKYSGVPLYLADPEEARGCLTNTVVIIN